MVYIHTVGFHAALKRNSAVCYNMDVLSEISHKKTNTTWFHSYEVLRVVRIIETENIKVGAREWGGENEELLFNGYRVSVWNDEKFWKLVIVAKQCECI